MRKQDYLLQLIQSLSPNEKRYFKLFCQTQTGGKHYLKLFNYLEEQTSYNPQAVAKALGITSAKLAHEKEYLQDVLLRNLRMFHENNYVESNLMGQYLQADLMYRKGLSTYAVSIAKKVLVKAVLYERFGLALGLTRLLSHSYAHLGIYDEMEKINEEEQRIIDQQVEYLSIIHLRDRFMSPVMNRTGYETLKDVAEHPLFKADPATFKSWHSRHCWNEMCQFYYTYVERNPAKALEHAQNLAKMFSKAPHFRSILPTGYFNAYANICVRQYNMGNYREALTAVNQLLERSSQKVPSVSPELMDRFHRFGLTTKMTLLSLLHQFNEACVFGEQVLKVLDTIKHGEQITFLFDYALSLFHTGDYDGCLKNLNRLIDMKTKERVDVQLYARLLFVMLQLQLKNYQLIPYQVKSIKAWKKRMKIDAEHCDELLGWFDKLGKAGMQQQWNTGFAKFKEHLQEGHIKELNTELALSKWKTRK